MYEFDEMYYKGGGMNARQNYYRDAAKNGVETPTMEGKLKKIEKTPEEIRHSNATYSSPQLDVEQLKARPRHSPGKNFDRCFDATVEVIGMNIRQNMVMEAFDHVFWQPALKRNIKQCGYTEPTPVQKHTLPYVLNLRDVIACAPTGSGKTAAYILPIMYHILQRGDVDWPHCHQPAPCAIVIAPTRELVDQIKDEARTYAHGTKIQVIGVYGGTNFRRQVDFIRKTGCNILVSTPGRLLQLLHEGRFQLVKCQFVVLDEAHRMLDGGTEEEATLRQILQFPDLPVAGHARQTLMFSATFPKPIRKLAEEFLRDYVFVAVGKVGGANEDIIQEILHVPSFDKYEKLYELITADMEKTAPEGRPVITKILVFVERKHVADNVAAILSERGVKMTSYHGDREQREREEALRDFKLGRCPILIATAVASRGLDIVGVDQVINFDLPQNIDDYVHRIGRTGRVGNPGRASSFYDPKMDKEMAKPLLEVLRDAKQDVPEWFLAECNGDKDKNKGAGGGGDPEL